MDTVSVPITSSLAPSGALAGHRSRLAGQCRPDMRGGRGLSRAKAALAAFILPAATKSQRFVFRMV